MIRAKKHIRQMLFLLAAGLLAGCSGSEGDGVNEVTPESTNEAKKTEISVKTNLSKMLTRATTIDNNTALQGYDLKIDAYYNTTNTNYLSNTKLHYTGGDPAWTFWDGSAALHYYWPIEGSVYDPSGANITVSSLDFVGYCPYATPAYITTGPTYSYSAGTISFAATMPTTTIDEVAYMTSDNQASLTEFMCAIIDNQTYADQEASGGVPLTFKHPFAYIKFNLSTATTKNVTVKSIKLEELKTGGSCVFNGTSSVWSSQSGSATMKLTEELQRDETEETSPFLVIPYNYGTKTLTVNIIWTEWDEKQPTDQEEASLSTTLDINWQAGYSYTYTLTIKKDDLIVDEHKFTEQW